MDNIIMDSELATEMVKLLAQELKVVRAQLREAERRTSTPSVGGPSNGLSREGAEALIAENDTLKADNAVLQEGITRLQHELSQPSSVKSEENLAWPVPYVELTSHTNDEFSRLLAENENLIREKEEASQSHAKLSDLQDKYRRSKAKVHEYNEMLNELRVTLSNCAEELEQSRNAVVAEIDFRDFLKDLPYEPVEGQSDFSSIQLYLRSPHTGLHKDAVSVCNGLCFIDRNEVIWCPSGIALGLVIQPTFQYNPKISGGAWTKPKDGFDVDKQMELCCSSGKTFRYLGTYERLTDKGTMVIASEILQYLDREKLDYVSKRTTLFPDLMPPSQTQMIKNMYKQGVIKLQCFVIRCVAFNEVFAEKLRETCTPSAHGKPSDSTASHTSPATSWHVRKRKRDSKSTVHSTRSTKKYEYLHPT